ncbi:MAG: ROK family protein [Bacteroidetes bacterium]|nr:ROK family protein [Bacteroidota bacterium]MCH8523936.1 ROK family protein [Balneolales bacterium]
MVTIGIDLGGTNIKGALIDSKLGILYSFSIETEADRGKDHVIDRVATAIKMAADKAESEIFGVGIGSPGVISYDRTTVSVPPNFPGWEKENLAEILKNKTGYECWVDNDANLMALGSSRFGMGQKFDSFIMITLGTGVGGGIIYQRKLYRGVTGGAAEFGHVIIDLNGPESLSPTKGGIEAYLGQRFLSKLAWDEIKKRPDNPLYEHFVDDPTRLEPVHLVKEADKGNKLATELLRRAGEKLGVAMVNYVHVLDIRKVVVSGGVAKAGEYILGPAREMAMQRLLKPFRTDFEILYEALGNDAALLGAGSLPLEHHNI